MALRVTVTIPAYLEQQFDQLSNELGLSRQDTFLHCFTNTMAWKNVFPSSVEIAEDGPDLYMIAPPERPKPYPFSEPGICLRGEETGEFHEIERGDMFAWVKFSRHSKTGADGWEKGKNGKLCEDCQPIALQLWQSGQKHF